MNRYGGCLRMSCIFSRDSSYCFTISLDDVSNTCGLGVVLCLVIGLRNFLSRGLCFALGCLGRICSLGLWFVSFVIAFLLAFRRETCIRIFSLFVLL